MHRIAWPNYPASHRLLPSPAVAHLEEKVASALTLALHEGTTSVDF